MMKYQSLHRAFSRRLKITKIFLCVIVLWIVSPTILEYFVPLTVGSDVMLQLFQLVTKLVALRLCHEHAMLCTSSKTAPKDRHGEGRQGQQHLPVRPLVTNFATVHPRWRWHGIQHYHDIGGDIGLLRGYCTPGPYF